MKKIIEKEFALNYLNKYGSQMTVGNGYLGVRGALEEEVCTWRGFIIVRAVR
ncbi:Uncharacterized glycosyl hydrolase ycjT [Listeria monocytogenes N53-1]|nr:Uncharacterized glycosyl hydrolase ycjT [Listeria monocytogenes]CCQ25555.1 Uncharacterized glycosyl hydrolase ycjT [Listeria monocytogenes N53-1]